MSQTRLLYIIGRLNLGGAERQLLALCRGLDDKRYDVSVCPLWPDGVMRPRFEAAGVRVLSVHKRARYDLTVVPRLALLMRKLRIGIVHTFLNSAGIWGRLAAILANVPTIISSERSIEPKPSVSLEKFLAHRTNCILANSKAVKDYFVGLTDISEDQCRVVYNGVDLSPFAVEVQREEIFRRKEGLGINGESSIIGIVANLHPVKDHVVFLRSAARIREFFPYAEFVIIGEGAMRRRLEELSSSLDLRNKVHFLGARSDVPQLLPCLDVFVLSSRREGFSNAILEAMAAARPVVATCVGGNDEAVLDGKTGFLVPPRDPIALAESVVRLLNDRELAQRMGQAGRRRIEINFTLERMVSQTERVYEDEMDSTITEKQSHESVN